MPFAGFIRPGDVLSDEASECRSVDDIEKRDRPLLRIVPVSRYYASGS